MRTCNLSYLISDAPTNRLRNIRPRLTLIFLVALVPWMVVSLAAGEQEPSPTIRIAREVAQGEVLEVALTAGNLAGASVALTDSDGASQETTAWRAAAHPLSGEAVWIALLGVPSTAATGAGEVRLSLARTDGGLTERRVPVWITPGAFRQERIALNAAMSDLRTSDDPRISEQSRILWQVIHRIDPTARRHLVFR